MSVAYRLLNDPRYLVSLSVLMWQTKQSSVKFWMPVYSNMEDILQKVVDAVLDSELMLVDLCKFELAVLNCLHKTPKVKRIPKGIIKGGRGPTMEFLAKKGKRLACGATSERPIVNEKDYDDCYLWHLANEVDLLFNR